CRAFFMIKIVGVFYGALTFMRRIFIVSCLFIFSFSPAVCFSAPGDIVWKIPRAMYHTAFINGVLYASDSQKVYCIDPNGGEKNGKYLMAIHGVTLLV
ncbi:MAG: hypothetical protein WCQ99_12035, partial [Pseudomonadota bacterium]